MRYIASLLAIAGLGLAIVLFARGDIAGIAGLLLTAGPGLLVASGFHVLPMLANARAWQLLLPESRRPGVWMLTRAIWVRESVNGLLPVARIGGEIVAYRMLRRYVTRRSEAAASLVADMGLSILSQAGFAIFGLSLLFSIAHSTVDTTRILAGVVGMLPLGAAF